MTIGRLQVSWRCQRESWADDECRRRPCWFHGFYGMVNISNGIKPTIPDSYGWTLHDWTVLAPVIYHVWPDQCSWESIASQPTIPSAVRTRNVLEGPAAVWPSVRLLCVSWASCGRWPVGTCLTAKCKRSHRRYQEKENVTLQSFGPPVRPPLEILNCILARAIIFSSRRAL